ncbi:hypothetical protein N7472_005808 [Penicillium cf. griseofulvum]|uniref:Uncharacterized protein n=1 Tax=Penicillium cf. griseofulvum TaxID=2972120 RepID=A0A9W9MFS7_9EURO|nr:hypothetical protein N7472_005808 [Penicillium cf. griseofulvum]
MEERPINSIHDSHTSTDTGSTAATMSVNLRTSLTSPHNLNIILKDIHKRRGGAIILHLQTSLHILRLGLRLGSEPGRLPSRISATLKIDLCHRGTEPSETAWNPNLAAARARFVHLFWMCAKCHYTLSGDAQRSNWLRTSMRFCMDVTSTLLTAAKSRIMARRVGSGEVGASSAMRILHSARVGPRSFQGLSPGVSYACGFVRRVSLNMWLARWSA